MAKKKKIEIFSYDPDDNADEPHLYSPGEQKLRVRIESKGRGGKSVTIIDGYKGLAIDDLAKSLKSKLGIGGSSKEGLIILQGKVREKTIELLHELGYRDTK